MWIIGIIEKNLSKTCLTTRELTDLQIFTNINIDVTINWLAGVCGGQPANC